MYRRSFGVFIASFLISAAQPQTFRVLVSKSEVNAVEGDTVTLSVRPSSPVISGFWKFRWSSIVTWTVEPPYLNVAYTKRNIALLFNTSLLLSSVEIADSGVYWITVDSRTGKEATANITLNVIPKPIPFTIVTESAEINATEGNTILLGVTPSKEVKNGSWQMRGKVVAQWNDTIVLVSAEYQRRVALFNKCSLQLKSASVSDTGEYKVSMSTESGDTSTASIQLNVLPKPVPFTIVTESTEINATEGNTIQLEVTPSEEVKKGSWQMRGKVVAQWNDTVALVSAEYQRRATLFNKCSLQLNSASVSDTGEYKVSMSTESGDTSTANIQLNVLQEAQPLKVTAELSQINAELRANVLLSVRVSGEIKNGSWSKYNYTLFKWNDTIHNITFDRNSNFALLPNASLLILDLYYNMDGAYIISLTSPTGMKATTSVNLHSFVSRKYCEVYNSILALLILLMLMLIVFFTVYIQRNHPKNHLQNFDLLVIFFKGYRTCLSIVTMVTFIFIILVAISVNKQSCVLGQRPVMNFVAS